MPYASSMQSGAAAERHERWQEVLVALATDPALRTGDLPAALRAITEAAARELGVARASVWWVEPDGLHCANLFDGAHHTGVVLAAAQHPRYFHALTKSRVLAADDARNDPRTAEFREGYLVPLGITSMLDAPIRAQGELVGVLCHEHVGERRSFTIDEQMFAASLADLVAQALAASAFRRELEPEPPLADLSGEGALGHFDLLMLLGRGGMAEVFLARDRLSRDHAVVKRLRGERALEPSMVAMLHDEGRIACRMNHPHVVRTHDVAQHKGATFLVMEYLRGQTLAALAERTRELDLRVPREAWLVAVADALAGLHYAHELCDERGVPLEIVHRDVTPRNLFVVASDLLPPRVKVLDFGVAKAKVSMHQTQTGMVKGTLAYMAPEQYEGDRADRRVDVYAMGVILWELLSGRRLRESGSLRELERSMASSAPLLETPQPAGLEEAVARALSPVPEDRFATAHAMEQAVRTFVQDETAARHALGQTLELSFRRELAELDEILAIEDEVVQVR